MYRFLIFCSCYFLTTPSFCQRNNFAFGFQSGNNFSQTIINTEFDHSPLNSDYFIGSSFGFVARSKLIKYKWQWGGFSQQFYLYAEYGLNATYSGYNYYYENQNTFQKQLTFSVPLLWVIRPAFHKYWYKSFKGKRIYPIVKGGFTFSSSPAQHIEKSYSFGEATLIEDIRIDKKINVSFKGALGLQKEFKNGRIIYAEFSVNTPLGIRTKGTIRLNSPQINEIATLAKQGNFYSIDLQYFIGKRTDLQRERSKKRKSKRGKSPKIIYNPRYY